MGIVCRPCYPRISLHLLLQLKVTEETPKVRALFMAAGAAVPRLALLVTVRVLLVVWTWLLLLTTKGAAMLWNSMLSQQHFETGSNEVIGCCTYAKCLLVLSKWPSWLGPYCAADCTGAAVARPPLPDNCWIQRINSEGMALVWAQVFGPVLHGRTSGLQRSVPYLYAVLGLRVAADTACAAWCI